MDWKSVKVGEWQVHPHMSHPTALGLASRVLCDAGQCGEAWGAGWGWSGAVPLGRGAASEAALLRAARRRRGS